MFYVDYGTVGHVEKKKVRFLMKEFSKDPIYALRGCLDSVKPNEGIWTLEAMTEFTNYLEPYCSVTMLTKVTAVNAAVSRLQLM